MIKKFIKIFLFFICLIGIQYTAKGQDKSFSYNVSYLKASEEKILNIKEYFTDFNEIPKSKNFGVNNGNYFFKVEIKNNKNKLQHIVLNINAHNINKLKSYKIVNDFLVTHAITGNKILYENRSIKSRFPNILVQLQPKENATFILQTNFAMEAYFPIKIMPYDQFNEELLQSEFEIGLYVGFWFLVFIINIILWILVKDSSYLLYCLFSIGILFGILSYEGIIANLFIQSENLSGNLEFVIHFFMNLSLSLFSYKFLDLKEHYPKIKLFIYATLFGMACFYILYLISNDFIFFAIGDLVGMTNFLIFWIISILLIKKMKYAKLYVVAYFFTIVAGFFYITFLDFGFHPISNRLLRFGCIIDLIIFTVGILYKMKLLDNENSTMKSELRNFLANNNKQKETINKTIDPFFVFLKENNISEKTLTIREVDVLKCISKGKTNKEISEELFVSINTVKFHIKNIYLKLDIKNRKEAVEKVSKIITSIKHT